MLPEERNYQKKKQKKYYENQKKYYENQEKYYNEKKIHRKTENKINKYADF